jgi:hypothetical protein
MVVIISTVTTVTAATTTPSGGYVGASVERATGIVIIGLTVIIARARYSITTMVIVFVIPVRVILGCIATAVVTTTITTTFITSGVTATVTATERRWFRVVKWFRRAVKRRAAVVIRRWWRRWLHVVVVVLVKVRGWIFVAVTVTVAIVRRLKLMYDVANLMYQACVWRHVQIHPGLNDFFTVLVFADLQRQQRVDTDQAQVQTVTTPQRVSIRVHRWVRTVGADGI